MEQKLAPILLFTYNRPQHTLETLQALQLNDLASQSVLYVHCDGPKKAANKAELDAIKKVRQIVREQQWCKDVVIIEQEKNLGLADSISEGVTKLFNTNERVIVLEDDIVTSPKFLSFMNAALETYKDEARVMHISGFYPDIQNSLPDFFFYNQASCWGWATWKSSWAYFNKNALFLRDEILKQQKVKQLNIDNSYPFLQHLEANITGKMNTWAVKWHAAVVLNNGLCLHPSKSYIQNIGFDDSGDNCGVLQHYNVADFNTKTFVKPKRLSENKQARKLMVEFNKRQLSQKKTLKKQLKKVIIKAIPKEFKACLKRKFRKKTALEHLANFPRYTPTSINLLGKSITIVDSASYVFMHKEIFDIGIYDFNSAEKAPYIIDGGANIGLATIFFKNKYPEAEIICFEPDKKVYDVLKNNIHTVFNYSNTTLINKGLWSKEKTLLFDNEGADAGKIIDENSQANTTSKIEVVPLGPYLNKPVDFLKLDIEGAENEVLTSIVDHLLNVKRIFVEYHSFVNEQQTLNDIIAILTKAQFRLYITAPGINNNVPFKEIRAYNGMDMQLNIYGVKTEINL